MISKEEVQHIAGLARLGLDKKEIKKFQKDISKILDYFDLLKEADVSKVEPTFNPSEKFIGENPQITRSDKAELQSPEKADKLIKAASENKGRYVKVKAVFWKI